MKNYTVKFRLYNNNGPSMLGWETATVKAHSVMDATITARNSIKRGPYQYLEIIEVTEQA